MQPLGKQAFFVDAESLWRAGEQWSEADSEVSEAYLEYAATLVDIRELPVGIDPNVPVDEPIDVQKRIEHFTRRPFDGEAGA